MSRVHPAMTDTEILGFLGARLAGLREAEGLTIEEAGEAAGLGAKTVWRAEKGQNPTLLTVVRLLRVYGRLEDLSILVPEAPPSPLQALRGRSSSGETS
ncbi:MAG: XRE family transcriptional regulator [Gemmatimonadales bacterium]|nr:MAG: XRE family transcriptional regulator [Gemmatimonadales bacterium]